MTTLTPGRWAAALLLGAMAFLPGWGRAAPAHSGGARPDYYQLTANYDGVRLDVRVNDMPVVLSARGYGSGVYIVNNLLTGADNTVTVIAEPPPGAAHVSADASIRVNVTAFPGQNGGGGAGRVLYDFQWKRKNAQAPLPSVQGRFRAAPPSEPLSWQSGAQLRPATLDEAGIRAQIERLHQALAARNVSQTTALLASEINDQGVGFGLPRSGQEDEQRSYYEGLFKEPTWGLTPIHYDALEYDLCGGGRVVRVHEQGGGVAFKSRPDKDGGSTLFDLFLSFINGHWVIVQ